MTSKPFNLQLLSERAQKGLNYPSTGAQNLAHSQDPFHPETNKQVSIFPIPTLSTLSYRE